MIMEKDCQLVEIYRTQHGAVLQCNRKNAFCLEYANGRSWFKVQYLLDFVKLVNKLDVAEMAKNPARHADIAIVMPAYSERCFVLTLKDIIDLRSILNGAKFNIQLNSIVRTCLVTPV